MEFWIQHPAADGAPVGFVRWLKWRASEILFRWHHRLASDALYPNCGDCGKPRKRGDHSKCFDVPF